MRFNPAYWNKDLPKASIQFMTFYYSAYWYSTNNDVEEESANNTFFINNARLNYSYEVMKAMPLKNLSRFIAR